MISSAFDGGLKFYTNRHVQRKQNHVKENKNSDISQRIHYVLRLFILRRTKSEVKKTTSAETRKNYQIKIVSTTKKTL